MRMDEKVTKIDKIQPALTGFWQRIWLLLNQHELNLKQ